MSKPFSAEDLEEGKALSLDVSKLSQVVRIEEKVIPVVVQDAQTKNVLILAYANQLALSESLKTGIATFWSTSRNELWVKGATSGNSLRVVDILVNCEQNSLLYRVLPQGGGVCHTKDAEGRYRTGCYYRRIVRQGELEFI